MKQSAVEWLVNELIRVGYFEDIKPNITFEQAKEMEKEQIIDAYETSHISMMTAKQYYNETFKNK